MLQSDLFAALGDRRFDLVVVNPPYFAKDPVDDAERAWFAGADLGYFDRFFAGLGDHLEAGPGVGTTLMVLGEGCDTETINAAASRRGFIQSCRGASSADGSASRRCGRSSAIRRPAIGTRCDVHGDSVEQAR